MHINNSKRKYLNFRLVVIPIQFLGFYILDYLLRPSDRWFITYSIQEIFYGLVFCTLLTEITIWISRLLDRHMPWQKKPLMRSLIQFIGLIIANVVFSYFYTFLILSISKKYNTSGFEEAASFRGTFTVTVILSLFISAILIAEYFLRQWKDAREESLVYFTKAEELKRVALEAELQSLRMQLDPHFLFNSFSTLSALIGHDDDLAQLFLQKLSAVYRYMTINVKKNLVSVEEELEFTRTYFYLMKIRFGENVKMAVDLSEYSLKKSIPPITMQLLIENAIKHNTASASRPLVINITEGMDNNIKVTNTLQRLNFNVPSTATGMKNVIERYKLLTDRIPEATECSGVYTVCVPLIDLND